VSAPGRGSPGVVAPPGRSTPWWRPVPLLVAVAGLAVAGYTLSPRRVAEAAATLGPAAAIGAASLLLLALVPRTVVSLACGALFGLVAGAAYALTAAIVAATVGFAAGRWLVRGVVAERLRGGAGLRRSDKLRGGAARLDSWLSRRGLLAVVVVRLVPIAPFGLVSYCYGATGVRTRHYLLGTLAGAAPSAVTWAGIGAAAIDPAGIGPLTLLPAALGLVVTAGAALWWRASMRRERESSELAAEKGGEPLDRPGVRRRR
jgi:uncharacterized membrane protein YdjX (TVP38/TMEM64 family)